MGGRRKAGGKQQASDKHRRSGIVLIAIGLLGALMFEPLLAILILAGIGELIYAITLREPQPSPPPPPPPTSASLTEQLTELDLLRSQGRVGDDEYAQLRAKLFSGANQAPQ